MAKRQAIGWVARDTRLTGRIRRKPSGNWQIMAYLLYLSHDYR